MLPPPSGSVLSPCWASGLRWVLADNLWPQAIDIDGDGTLDSQEVRRLLLDLGREATDLDEAALALAMAEMRGGGGGKTPVPTHASSSSRHGRTLVLMAVVVFCADQSGAVRAVVVAAQGGRHFRHARRRRQKLDRDLCSLWQEEEAKPCAQPRSYLPFLRRSCAKLCGLVARRGVPRASASGVCQERALKIR